MIEWKNNLQNVGNIFKLYIQQWIKNQNMERIQAIQQQKTTSNSILKIVD